MSYSTLLEQSPTIFFFTPAPRCHYMRYLIQIGEVIEMTTSLQTHISFTLVGTPSLGPLKSSGVLCGPQRKPNTELSPIQPQRYDGYVHFSLKLGLTLPFPPVIYCDNIDAIYICANLVFHSRMKHVALNYHFIRNQVHAGIL